MTSYQYTRKSDLDAHVVINADKFKELELPGGVDVSAESLLERMNEDWREVLNVEEQENIYGTLHPLEFYFELPERMTERFEKPERHDGIYSLFEDKWLVPPRTIDIDFDPEKVFADVLRDAEEIARDFDLQMGDIFRGLKDVDLLLEAVASLDPQHKILFAGKIKQKLEEVEKEIEDFVEKGIEIKEKRQQEEYGMTSPQNIIFKYLARYGYLYVYWQLKKLLDDDERITEDEVERAMQILQERMSSMRISNIVDRFGEYKKRRWAKNVNLSKEDLLQDARTIWHRISTEVNRRFNEGYATCTFATKEVVESLLPKYAEFIDVVDGTYDGEPHWYPIVSIPTDSKVERYIIDLGNNIKHLNDAEISAELHPYPDPNYSVDSMMTPEAFLAFYPTIAGY